MKQDKDFSMNAERMEIEAMQDTQWMRYKYLLEGIESLTKPDYPAMNQFDGRNDRLLHAVLCAYAKHHLNSSDIGWDQLGNILHSAICNEIGSDECIRWIKRIPR